MEWIFLQDAILLTATKSFHWKDFTIKTMKTETQFHKLLNKYFVKIFVNIVVYINTYKYVDMVSHVNSFISTHGPF